MASFIESLRAAARTAYCSNVASSPQWFGNLRRVILPPGLIDLADRINRSICGPDAVTTPVPPPFTGGQCPGIRYQVPCTSSVTRPGCPGGPGSGPFESVNAISPIVFGPIRGIGVRPTAQGLCGPTTIVHFIQAFNSSGAPVDIEHTPVPSGRTDRTVTVSPSFGAAIPIDPEPPGGCGSIDPVLPPPAPIQVNVTVNYENFEGTSLSITAPIIFAPVYVAVDGTLRIPISFDNLVGEINLNNDFQLTLDFSPGGGDQPSPGEPDNPGLDPGEPSLDGDNDPAGPDATIIGVVVRSRLSQGNRTTLIPHTVGPDILAPGVATVRFRIRAGSLVAWTSDIRVKGVNEYVPCPVDFGATAVSVESEVGWQSSFTVVRARPLTTFEP